MEITFVDLYRQFNLRRNICITWANKLCLEVAKLPPFIQNFKHIPAFSPLFGDQKHFTFLYFKWTEVIPFDYAGYTNLNRHGAVVAFANLLNLANAFVAN